MVVGMPALTSSSHLAAGLPCFRYPFYRAENARFQLEPSFFQCPSWCLAVMLVCFHHILLCPEKPRRGIQLLPTRRLPRELFAPWSRPVAPVRLLVRRLARRKKCVALGIVAAFLLLGGRVRLRNMFLMFSSSVRSSSSSVSVFVQELLLHLFRHRQRT